MLWRVFPYDRKAKAGQPFSSSYTPINQGSGRFDIPQHSPVLYLAESPVHALAEVLQGLRNQSIDKHDLIRFGFQLAIVAVEITNHSILDLCDPVNLLAYDIRPDSIASNNFKQTQGIATTVFENGFSGLRWWSSLSGDWHSTVVFTNRVFLDDPRGCAIRFDEPVPIEVNSPELIAMADSLSIKIGRS